MDFGETQIFRDLSKYIAGQIGVYPAYKQSGDYRSRLQLIWELSV
ncbi:hypothetical protein FACS1894167_14670 [Synergistales bacterium]|nr:hypothetical protein FACS1894167_14670 [Synergistales bacterium]